MSVSKCLEKLRVLRFIGGMRICTRQNAYLLDNGFYLLNIPCYFVSTLMNHSNYLKK